MRFRALTRSLLAVTCLLLGMGHPLSALAHGTAHAHEAQHRNRGTAAAREHEHEHDRDAAGVEQQVAPVEHHHDHAHATLGASLKSRSDVAPYVASAAMAMPTASIVSVSPGARVTAFDAPPPERRHTPASPRAPPAR